jgi:hypothetical protein
MLEPYEYKISSIMFDATFGASESNKMLESLVNAANEDILTTPIVKSYI